MNELDGYNSGEQIDSLLNQMEDMEQELTGLAGRLNSENAMLSRQNQTLQKQTAELRNLKNKS